MECPEIDVKLEIDAKGDKLENGEEGAKKLNELSINNESFKVRIDGFIRIMYLTHDQFNFKIISFVVCCRCGASYCLLFPLWR
jgi:hypothetical protein